MRVMTLIRARRLFILPVLASFLIFIPYVGILFMLIVWFVWYNRNRSHVHSYFRGKNYELKDDLTKEELAKLR